MCTATQMGANASVDGTVRPFATIRVAMTPHSRHPTAAPITAARTLTGTRREGTRTGICAHRDRVNGS